MNKLIIFIIILILFSMFSTTIKRKEAPFTQKLDSPNYTVPLQKNYTGQTLSKKYKGYNLTITPVATYKIKARVISKKRYITDFFSELAPYDLALAWGDLALRESLKGIKYGQSGRRCYYIYSSEYKYDGDYISTHFANVHIIHANKNILRGVQGLKKYDEIYVEGYLVNVDATSSNGAYKYWNSSLSRDDTGDGACELFYVTKLITSNSVYK